MRPRSLAMLLVAACTSAEARRPDTIVLASGADLQSANPLVTTHPLARQVQRYVLLTTLVQRDSALAIQPYLARHWEWSADSTRLVMRLSRDLSWHDGAPTTARDAAWTLDAARHPSTAYPRSGELAAVTAVAAPDDSTLVVGFASPQRGIPDVFTDLGILPRHLLDTVPLARMREAAWNRAPVGNGPFRFVAWEPGRRWVFERHDAFPASHGGPPRIRRLVVAVVDEPTTKLAALAAGELDFAGINPAHAPFVRRHAALDVIDYPLLLTYVIAFNSRRAPFDAIEARRAVAAAIDRRAVVDGYLFGFGTPSSTPWPATLGPAMAMPPAGRPARPIRFELLTVGSGDAALEQLLQSQLGRLGIHATIRQVEMSTFLDRVYGPAHDFDAAVMGVTGDPALGHLPALLRVTGIGGEGLAPFVDSVPVAVLYHARGVQGMNRRVHGVAMDIRGELATIRNWTMR